MTATQGTQGLQVVTAGPSLSMRLIGSLLGLFGSDLKGPQFDRWRENISMRSYPQPPAMPKGFHSRFRVQERDVGGQPVYTLTPLRARRPIHIIYTHGGAYVSAMRTAHWDAIGKLVEQLGATVTVPIYPLAPEHTYCAAFQMLETVYCDVLRERPGGKIVLCGDSAGGGLALAQALHYRDLGLRLPDRVVLFAPWLDITLSNPGAAAIEPQDAMLGIPGLVQCGRWWAGGDDPRSPLLSPLYGDLSGLPPVDIFQGTADLLAADARLLADKVAAAGGAVRLFEYTGAFHVFMAATFTPEARHVYSQVAGALA